MFEIITKAQPGELKPETRASVIRAGLYEMAMGCRELPHVVREMSQVQRNRLRLSLCEAIATLDTADDVAAGVARVAAEYVRVLPKGELLLSLREEARRAAENAEAVRPDVAAS